MKAILGITLCVLTVWMTVWGPHPAVSAGATTVASEGVPQCAATDAAYNPTGTEPATVGGARMEIGAVTTAFPAELAAAEGGWWNWVRKILRAILDLIPGGDEDCGEEPQP